MTSKATRNEAKEDEELGSLKAAPNTQSSGARPTEALINLNITGRAR